MPPKVSQYFRFKRYVDVIGVVCISVVLVPMILVFVLLVRLASKGPVFYSQLRCGKDGKPFNMYKIRSMIVNAETDGAVWACNDDPRITAIEIRLRYEAKGKAAVHCVKSKSLANFVPNSTAHARNPHSAWFQ